MNVLQIACTARPANLPWIKFVCSAFGISADFTLPDTGKALMCFGADHKTQLSFEPLLPDGFELVTYTAFGEKVVEWINNEIIGPEMPDFVDMPAGRDTDDDYGIVTNFEPGDPTGVAMARIDDVERVIDAIGQDLDAKHDKHDKRINAQSNRINRQNGKYKKLLDDVNDVLSSRGNAIDTLRADVAKVLNATEKHNGALGGIVNMLEKLADRVDVLEQKDIVVEREKKLITIGGKVQNIDVVTRISESKKSENYNIQYNLSYDVLPLPIKDETTPATFDDKNVIVYETETSADTQKELLPGPILRTWLGWHTDMPTSIECNELRPGMVIAVSDSDKNVIITRRI